jgi:hypothetical protein
MNVAIAALCLAAYFGLSAVVGGDRWFLISFGHTLIWPLVFAFAILPGVLIGRYMRTWQTSIIMTEVITTVGATVMVHPTLADLFQPSFRHLLAMAHLAVFPPLLLSILLGHYSRSWRSDNPA